MTVGAYLPALCYLWPYDLVTLTFVHVVHPGLWVAHEDINISRTSPAINNFFIFNVFMI